jgi:hypothetical protein
VGNWITGPGRRKPWRTWELGVQYRDRDDLAPVDPRFWSPGRTLNASASLAIETVEPRRTEQIRIALVHGAPAFRDGSASPASPTSPAAGGGFTSARLEARQSLDFLADGALRFTWRLAAGTASRHAPREQHFDIAQASRLDALARFYENDRGPLRESDHYLSEGGGGLRGFADHAVLGRRLLALNLEASHAVLPLAVFAGIGRVDTPGTSSGQFPAGGDLSLRGRTLADLGVSYAYRRVRLLAPFWISRPDPGERPWDVRWLVSLDLAGLHPWW